MGLKMWAQKSLMILREGGGKGSFPLGKERRLHRIMPLSKAVRSKLRKTRAYGEALLKERGSKLVHLKDWIKVFKTLGKKAKGVPGLSGGQKSYFFRWSTRQWLDRLMRLRSNWKGLGYDPKTSVWHLAQAFPDQRAHLSKLCGGHRGLCRTSIRNFCKSFQYEAPIEHLTMNTCLCLTPKIQQMMNAVIDGTKGPITPKKEKAIAKKLEKVRKVHTKRSKFGIPIPPHPAVTVAEAHASLLMAQY